jgi:enolase
VLCREKLENNQVNCSYKARSKMKSLVKVAVSQASTACIQENSVHPATYRFSHVSGKYDLQFKSEESSPDNYLATDALEKQYSELFSEFPALVSIEDPFAWEDWEGWSSLTSALPGVQVVANELTVTNSDRLNEAIEKQAGNSFIVKLTHVGSITEAINCIKQARVAGWSCVVSAGYHPPPSPLFVIIQALSHIDHAPSILISIPYSSAPSLKQLQIAY